MTREVREVYSVERAGMKGDDVTEACED